MQYAVRGEVPIRAGVLSKELESERQQGISNKRPFGKILFCNIGNPQSVGQKPITFFRSVLSLVDNPRLLTSASVHTLFEDEEIERAHDILSYLPNGSGAYSDSQGVEGIRRNVAQFVEKRDGYSCEPSNIFLTNGASSAIQMLLTALIADENDSIMIPTPQYPIYSALISLLNGKQAGYYLDEESNWSLNLQALESSFDASVSQGHRPRAMVVINPGNPTGNTMSYDDLCTVVRFCEKHNLVLMSDEVYQENCYNPTERPFVSCKKIVQDLGSDVELASFHSTSKGFIGECGRRGGYMEMHNFDPQVQAEIVKLASSGLCSNLDGQLMLDLMVKPPTKGVAYSTHMDEKSAILDSLKVKADMVYEMLNQTPGVSCQPLEGAMYAFPKLDLPKSFVDRAIADGKSPDSMYAISLLESTGICTVPGSGFGQVKGTHHVRMTFLPPKDELENAMKQFQKHHMSIR